MAMTDKEKQAIERLRRYQKAVITEPTLIDAIESVLNLIENQQYRIKDLEQKLNAKEILSHNMPEDTEFVIMTRANYERNFGEM